MVSYRRIIKRRCFLAYAAVHSLAALVQVTSHPHVARDEQPLTCNVLDLMI
jgi:hypothetical protein